MERDNKAMFLLGLVFIFQAASALDPPPTSLGYTAFISKSHSDGKDDPVLQYVVKNSLREDPVLAELKKVSDLIYLGAQCSLKQVNLKCMHYVV